VRDLKPVLADHPFFAGLDPQFFELLVGCARNVRFDPDEYLFREGDSAEQFYLLRHGQVALESRVHHKPVVVETLEPGDAVGWSWLIPPYRWRFDARALELTRAVALDGVCLRKKCDEDPTLGYDLFKRVSGVMADRLQHVWLHPGALPGGEPTARDRRRRDAHAALGARRTGARVRAGAVHHALPARGRRGADLDQR
jgi:CRP-like cAMP-binding protein